MKADLHFHPCFFNRGAGFQFTQWKAPTLKEILNTASSKKVDILTITSCSTHEHVDPRWYEHISEIDEIKDYNFKILNQKLKATKEGQNLIYIFHGQELKTDKADLNILFAEERVRMKGTKGKIESVIDAAKNSGDEVLIGINQLSRCMLTEKELREFYETGKVNFLEYYN